LKGILNEEEVDTLLFVEKKKVISEGGLEQEETKIKHK